MINRTLFSAIVIALLTNACARGEEHVMTLKWSELKSNGKLKVGEVISPQQDKSPVAAEELLLVNDSNAPASFVLATLEPTGVTKFRYSLRGQIRYEGVTEAGHLEMWSVFKDGGRYFSKTLSPSGPMGKILGTSNSREFILPFQSSEKTGAPVRIEVSLVLPGAGKVWISPLVLSEFDASEWPMVTQVKGAWWGRQAGAWLGGILGPLLGILGAIVGSLSNRGRGKKFCFVACRFVTILGVVALVFGLVAVLTSQPYDVYFPLFLLGVIACIAMSVVIPQLRKRFADLELRKIDAMDAGIA